MMQPVICRTSLAQGHIQQIFALKKVGHNQVPIADLVGVYTSAVSREFWRNKSQTGYYAQAAHRHAQQRPYPIADWLGQAQRISFHYERIYPYLRPDQQAGELNISNFGGV
jgi:IS30 family transposase